MHILVERNSEKYNSFCPKDASCLDDIISRQESGNYVVKGVTMVGWEEVGEETKELLSDSEFRIGSNVILLKEDSEPQSNWLSILMMIGGVLGIILTLGSFLAGDENDNSKDTPKKH